MAIIAEGLLIAVAMFIIGAFLLDFGRKQGWIR